MKRNLYPIIIALMLTAAAFAFGGYWIGTRQQPAPAARAMTDMAAPAGKPAAERTILYWHDPMVPGQKFDKPGRSPFMAMDLVPVYAEPEQGAPAAAASVSIATGMQQNLGVRLAEVSKAPFDAGFDAVGNVAFNERARVQLQARSNGFVEKVFVRAPLDPVRKGQALLQLTVPDWIAVQEDYLAVKRLGAAAGDGLLGASAQRMRLAGMNEGQIAAVVKSGKVNARTTVTAPAAGVVTVLSVREGMTVAVGAPLFEINGLSTVWVNAEVPESAAAALRPGASAQVSSAAFPGLAFEGKVEALLPEVDAATRTLKARIEVANPGGKLVPGMFTRVRLGAQNGGDALSVPSEAVIQTGRRSVVMVARGKQGFDGVEVVTGRQRDGRTEILKGLREGDKVVASGQFLIDSEANLRGALARTAAPAPVPAPAPAPASASAPAVAETTYLTRGRIERIGRDEVTISHEPIAALDWGPMTMGFKPPADGLPPGLKAGDTVQFEIARQSGGGYRIASIKAARAPGAHR